MIAQGELTSSNTVGVPHSILALPEKYQEAYITGAAGEFWAFAQTGVKKNWQSFCQTFAKIDQQHFCDAQLNAIGQ